MAEESANSLATPEKKGPNTGNISKMSADSRSNRNNTLACHRRASIGAYPSADSSQNAVPHYLRASTGSCHDFCKFGREHSFEKKERKPFRKRIGKPLPSEPYSVQILVSYGRKKEKAVGQGPSMDRKKTSPDQKPSSDTKLSDTKSYASKPKSSLDKDKPSKDTKKHSPGLPSPPNKSYYLKPKVPSDAKTHPQKENGSSGNKSLLSKSKPAYSKQLPSADPPEIVKSVIFPSTEVEGPAKRGSSTDNKTSRTERKTTSTSRKQSSPVKSKPFKVKTSSSSENPDGKGRRNIINAKKGKSLIVSKAPAKKVLVAPAAIVSPKLCINKTAHISLGKTGNVKFSSPLKDQNRIQRVKTKESNDEKVSEKTLHVVEMETENNASEPVSGAHAMPSLPSPSSTESLSYTNSSSSSSSEEYIAETEESGNDVEEVISDNDGSQEIVIKVQSVKENQNKTPRKSRAAVPEEKYRSPVKLKFRTGKVVDLQSDNNTPRRLRFRKARVIGAEDSKGNSRRALKKSGANDDTTGAEVSSEKVVLKHQDVQDKKDAQGLFNNVIEETASKLVESRKSKVKALVGAFETVISLQETKPTT